MEDVIGFPKLCANRGPHIAKDITGDPMESEHSDYWTLTRCKNHCTAKNYSTTFVMQNYQENTQKIWVSILEKTAEVCDLQN